MKNEQYLQKDWLKILGSDFPFCRWEFGKSTKEHNDTAQQQNNAISGEIAYFK